MCQATVQLASQTSKDGARGNVYLATFFFIETLQGRLGKMDRYVIRLSQVQVNGRENHKNLDPRTMLANKNNMVTRR